MIKLKVYLDTSVISHLQQEVLLKKCKKRWHYGNSLRNAKMSRL